MEELSISPDNIDTLTPLQYFQMFWKHDINVQLFGQLPKYLQNRVQKSAPSYVIGRYAKLCDVINLNWLPIHESIEYNSVECAYHSPHDRNWTSYLRLKTVQQKRVTRIATE